MLYLSGIHALNLPCDLLTCGDWHTLGINWGNIVLLGVAAGILSNLLER